MSIIAIGSTWIAKRPHIPQRRADQRSELAKRPYGILLLAGTQLDAANRAVTR
jgi:hypothetical protein